MTFLPPEVLRKCKLHIGVPLLTMLDGQHTRRILSRAVCEHEKHGLVGYWG